MLRILIPIRFVLFSNRNLVLASQPSSQIDQLATLRTKRAVWVGQFPSHNFAALRTIDDRWFHDHSLKTEPTGRMTGRGTCQAGACRFLFYSRRHCASTVRFPPRLLPMLSVRFDLFNCSSHHTWLSRGKQAAKNMEVPPSSLI